MGDNIELMACPGCNERLAQLEKCDSCNLEFDNDEGTPILFRDSTNKLVTFDFSSDRSTISDELLQTILRDPPKANPEKGIPYHLDKSHLHVLNQLKKDSLVLEIGCGGAQNRGYFEEKGLKYVGTDISKTRVFDWLQKYGGPDYLCDAHFLPFRDQQFDLVYCAAVFEHLACPILAAQEIFRVLKPGGYFLGNVSFLEPWHDNSFFHMTPLGVIEILTQAKLQPKYIWPGNGYSGYYATMAMGSLSTRTVRWLGKALYSSYRTEHKVKDILRKNSQKEFKDIMNRAAVAGATDWIAYRPT